MNGEEAIKKFKDGDYVAIKRNAWGDTAWCTLEGPSHSVESLMTGRRVPISRVDIASDDWEGALPPKDPSNPAFAAMVAAMAAKKGKGKTK